MLFYNGAGSTADIALGKDARYYRPELPGLDWNDERQPFGYSGVQRLFEALENVLSERGAK